MTDSSILESTDLATKIAGLELTPNATFKSPPSGKDFWDLDIVKAFVNAVSSGQTYRFLGDPGVGKTAFVLWICRELGLKTVYIPAALVAPEDLAVPMPKSTDDGMQLEFLLYSQLTSPEPKVIVIDELSRASKQVQNQLLELVQQKRLADIPIPGIVTILSMDNEGAENGITMQPDFTQSDRWATVKVDSNKIPWRWGLADTFSDVDLTGVYRVYARLSPSIRKRFSPRVLEHVIFNGLNGFPLVWGLPIQAGHEGPDGSERVLLIDENGHDHTDEVLDAIASALGVQNRATIGDPLERALDAVISGDECHTLFINGAPGTGKTAFVREKAEASGCEVLLLSGPVISPDNLVVPMPNRDTGELELMVLAFLKRPGRKILIIDEIWRTSQAVRNKLMEILQQNSIGGQEIPGLVAVIGINNPKTVAGYKLEVGRADRAQVERFDINIEVSASDVPAKGWLLRTYGEEAEPFIEWWEEDLDDLGRFLITKRGLERLIGFARDGLPLEWAKPYMDGEYVPVSLHDLEARLAKRPVARLRAVAAKVDFYEDQLADGENTQAQTEVFFAFSRADETQLEEHRDVCVRLLAHMSQQHVINLLRPSGKRQAFWHGVLKEAHASKGDAAK